MTKPEDMESKGEPPYSAKGLRVVTTTLWVFLFQELPALWSIFCEFWKKLQRKSVFFHFTLRIVVLMVII